MKENNPLHHRDINWLSFNDRVLQEAADKSNPLFERLKFIAIFSSNLDEHFRVRVSQLRQLKKVEKSIRRKLALKPNKIVKQILHKVQTQQETLGALFFEQIAPELSQNGIHLISYNDLKNGFSNQAHLYYEECIEKLLKPIKVEASKSSDIILENQKLYFLITFDEPDLYGIVNIPSDVLDRFVILDNRDDDYYLAFIDDIIRLHLEQVFPDEKIMESFSVKLSRDAELYLDQELGEDLAEQIYNSLSQREKGQPTRFLYDNKMPKEVCKNIRKSLGLGKIDMVAGGRYHNFDDLFKFPDPTDNPVLHINSFKPVVHKNLGRKNVSYFDIIREKDQLVHFPYMSFNYVQSFIDAAARDPDVQHIKISLYRVASESALTTSLLTALDNGKKITVFVEAKARFDEKNNIRWGRIFEEKGARVIYSYPKIKVHSKVLLILRKESGKIMRYAYIGTGNFNAMTSKIYCDHGLFTANRKVTKDLSRVFKVLQGDLIIPRAKRLLISPFKTRRTFEHLIRNEIDLANAGKIGAITAKMNQLEDPDIIKLLYEAGQAGVKIRLIVRGFTCLIPGIKGLSDTIEMTSIVDTHLEHGRIYKFHNDGQPKMFMGSADWMTRNLDRRIEVLAPILDSDLFKELEDILEIQLRDNVKARIHTKDESNPKVKRAANDEKIRSQEAIYNYLRKKHLS
ncbi:MAG: polyphosphate kinase 1 [Nonlabens sp.]